MKLIEFPRKEICDVIVLVNTADLKTFEMTQACINSIHSSEKENIFRIILVESNNSNEYKNLKYTNVDHIIKFKEDFNYNKALNLAFDNCGSEFICVINNDTFALENWYSILRYYMSIFDLKSASPVSPTKQNGPSAEAQSIILNYPDHVVVLGYEPIIHLAGWCWLMERETLQSLRPFPEELGFWFSDNYMGLQLKKLGYRHATVTSSKVIHYGQESYKYIDSNKLHNMTFGLQNKYQKLASKWN